MLMPALTSREPPCLLRILNNAAGGIIAVKFVSSGCLSLTNCHNPENGPVLTGFFPFMFPTPGLNPYSETNSLGTLADFIQPSLHLAAGAGGWGRGR
jgi:hypothetical protein